MISGWDSDSAWRTSFVLEDSRSQQNPFPIIISFHQCSFDRFLLKVQGWIDNCLFWGFCGRCHKAGINSMLLWGFFFFSPCGPDSWLQVSIHVLIRSAAWKRLSFTACNIKHDVRWLVTPRDGNFFKAEIISLVGLNHSGWSLGCFSGQFLRSQSEAQRGRQKGSSYL